MIFSADIDSGIVDRLKMGKLPTVTLSLSALPKAGDILRINRMRGERLEGTEDCIIVSAIGYGAEAHCITLELKFS